ncbi:uncharacterized protein LOC100825807 [Brachypodium distachyon]|uniref:Uncharacterized protein n=1 Tax=Brachypodium distachyon TaxID=15368 RepID=A0A2K2D9E7_BRADI|nr:uncharacterized protein LOC100825807 [Brachypodium distachyon]PNT70895.1 hypothetical protein BRADI_2g19460v3 [Brachypodium distachyon]|eukprot:XP_003566027.2 uncharacterized protein LOC100825807 [Brachypodium distachyon]
MNRGFEMGSDQEWAAMEEQHDGDGDIDVGRREDGPAAPAALLSGKKLWRMARAVHLVLARGLGKHQPKLAALGVHLHHLLSPMSSSMRHCSFAAPALSCRSVDAVHVHPYPRSGGGRITGGAASSLSCRSMDPGAAVYSKYEYRPREVEFSCSSTPLHSRRRRRRRRSRRRLLQQDEDPEHGSAAAVTRLYDLMDGDEEEEGDVVEISGAGAPRQVRITDSPFPAAREEEDDEAGLVDRRADEFIVWFHGQLRMQQQQQQPQRPAAARELARHVPG